MSTLSVTFPALVQQLGKGRASTYRIRPLFMTYPEASHQRFDRAMSIFMREVRATLRNHYTGRQGLDELLWYNFNPDVTYHKLSVNFRSGPRTINGTFGVATFKLRDQTFVSLPSVDNHLFVAMKDKQGKVKLLEQVEAVLQDLFRQKRKEYGKDWNPEHMYVRKGEFVTTVDVSVHVKQAQLPFEIDPFAGFAALLGGSDNFDGSEEIDKVAIDLNVLYPYDLQRAYEREDQVQRIQELLYRKDNTPVVLLGPIGAGKTTLVHEAVHRHMTKNQKKEFFRVEKVWHLDPVRVIAGMSVIGMWQKRLEAILHYALHRLDSVGRGTDKLFVDNAVALLRIGKSAGSNLNLGSLLKTYLEKRQLQLVIEATPEEWNVVQEMDRGFADLFTIVRVPAADTSTAIRIASRKRAMLELDNQCTISNLAMHRLFALQRAYMRQKALPGSVVDFLYQLATKYRHRKVEEEDVMNEFGTRFQLHSRIFDRNNPLQSGEVEDFIDHRLIGQPQAAGCLASTVHLLKAGLNDPSKPVSAFLFIGPTGVGKTQAAKVLTRFLFQSEDNIVRFDMNEFLDAGSVARLVGNLNNPEGQLTGRVRHRPFCVLLLDEIEKAHPLVHDLLLQLLGEGRLTDALGRTVDFTNTIVIMTSNIGAQEASKVLGFGDKTSQAEGKYKKALETTFRPEFLNRIDKVVTFSKLQLEDVMAIARLQMEELLQRDGFLRRTTILSVDKDALQQVAERGFDPELGGRALKRAIERELTVLAAEQLVSLHKDVPILFEVGAQDGKLRPRVTPLLPVQRLEHWEPPGHPEENMLLGDLKLLLEVANQALEQINQHLDETHDGGKTVFSVDLSETEYEAEQRGPNEASELYMFRERIIDLQHELQELVVEMDVTIPEITPRYRHRVNRIPLDRWSRPSKEIHDYLARMDIQDFIREVQVTAPLAISRSQSEYLRFFLKLAFYRFFVQDLKTLEPKSVVLQIDSMVEARGAKSAQHLSSVFQSIMTELGLTWRMLPVQQNNQQAILCQGTRVDELLQGEEGIHMYYVPFQTPIPLQVSLHTWPEDMDTNELKNEPSVDPSASMPWFKEHKPSTRILRLYALESGSQGTVTDLRTNWIGPGNLAPEDWLMLLYAGLPESEHITLENLGLAPHDDED